MSPECLKLRHLGDLSHVSVISVNNLKLSEMPEFQTIKAFKAISGMRRFPDVLENGERSD